MLRGLEKMYKCGTPSSMQTKTMQLAGVKLVELVTQGPKKFPSRLEDSP